MRAKKIWYDSNRTYRLIPFKLVEYGIPCIGSDTELWVVEAVVSGCSLTFDLKAFSYEQIFLEDFFVIVGILSGDLWLVPIYGS